MPFSFNAGKFFKYQINFLNWFTVVLDEQQHQSKEKGIVWVCKGGHKGQP